MVIPGRGVRGEKWEVSEVSEGVFLRARELNHSVPRFESPQPSGMSTRSCMSLHTLTYAQASITRYAQTYSCQAFD